MSGFYTGPPDPLLAYFLHPQEPYHPSGIFFAFARSMPTPLARFLLYARSMPYEILLCKNFIRDSTIADSAMQKFRSRFSYSTLRDSTIRETRTPPYEILVPSRPRIFGKFLGFFSKKYPQKPPTNFPPLFEYILLTPKGDAPHGYRHQNPTFKHISI